MFVKNDKKNICMRRNFYFAKLSMYMREKKTCWLKIVEFKLRTNQSNNGEKKSITIFIAFSGLKPQVLGTFLYVWLMLTE